MERSTLSPLLLDKVREQVERTQHLLGLIPRDKRSWRPDWPGPLLTLGDLLGHILECLAGFCAALYQANPERLAHFLDLKALPVNHSCDVEEARGRIGSYLRHVEEAFDVLSDEHLSRVVPTLFVPEGEALFTILLGNLEHLINHKYQLFVYLKMLGVPVATPDLYRLRGQAG
ncbi:MAG TPA: DinB family protein [Vicinamibacteria bacterium]|nr:DinB family protein [Vicinamibacteria bacterium]